MPVAVTVAESPGRIVVGVTDDHTSLLQILLELERVALDGEIEVANRKTGDNVADGATGAAGAVGAEVQHPAA